MLGLLLPHELQWMPKPQIVNDRRPVSCAIRRGSAIDFGVSGESRSPSRTSRTVRREQPSARAISRSPRPSASRRRISSYRCTVMLRTALLPPSWLPTRLQVRNQTTTAHEADAQYRFLVRFDYSNQWKTGKAPIGSLPTSPLSGKIGLFLLSSTSADPPLYCGHPARKPRPSPVVPN